MNTEMLDEVHYLTECLEKALINQDKMAAMLLATKLEFAARQLWVQIVTTHIDKT